MTNLPIDVKSFLMDVAQMVEIEGVSIDYTMIYNFAENATTENVSKMRIQMGKLADLDFDFEDPDTTQTLSKVMDIVKGEKVC